MTQPQIKCVHCEKLVDKDMCHVSKICPYCGGRMNIPPNPAPTSVPEFNDSDDDDMADGVVGAVVAGAILATVFSDSDDPYAGDEDPSFGGLGGGGGFSGGGADDSW